MCFPVKFAKFLRTPFLTEPLWWLLLRAPNFVSVHRICTIQNTSNSLAKTHLRTPFYRTAPSASKCQLFFLKREKQKQFFIHPLTLIGLKLIASKLKSFYFIILQKLLESILQFFQYKVRKTTLCLLFTFMFIFFFKFLQTSLTRKELIKHENKFNRKVFHERENSEN